MALLTSDLLRRALIELVVLGLVCGPLGVWVLHLRHTYAAESLAHAMLPGLVLAALAGAPLVLGAAGGVLVAAVLIALAGLDRRIGGELAVAVVVGTLFGAGAALALAPATPANLSDLLFGDPLGVTDTDLAVGLALCAGVLAVLGLAGRGLRLAAFDPVSARSLGGAPGRASAVLLAVLGVAIVAGAQGLGNLLVVAMIVAPAAAAVRASDRLAVQLRLAALLGALSGAAGLELSYQLDVAAGPAVALVACGLAVGAALGRPSAAVSRAAVRRRGPIEGLAGGG
jgi:ABC-type Mn2+/Zn2+ transport system permease subunit